MLLVDAFPELARELEELLMKGNEVKLARSIRSLLIVERCRCGDDFCASFYTAPKPKGNYGSGHRNVELAPQTGILILDVVDDRIYQVEVLYRDDIRSTLHSVLPSTVRETQRLR